jgi:Mrp family chromosome partitioning ATPase
MMKGRIHTDSRNHEFRLLRNRIEADIHAPAVLLVTSATGRDGAGVTAFGLAESLSKTHQRTALVTSANPTAPGPQLFAPPAPALRRRASDPLEGRGAKASSGLSVVSISQERLATISRSSVASLVEELRSEHDYVVVDGGDLPNNSFALLLAASADAVLVTFLAGRQQTQQDRVMLDTLERTESKMLGVVMTDQEAINEFAARDIASENREIASVKRVANPFVHRLEVALNRALGKSF